MLGTSKSVWGFDPRSVPGCQLWLDAADSSTITGTTSVTSWADKSGNGRNTTTTGTVSYANSGVSITASNSYLTGSFGSPDYTGSTVTCFLIASISGSSGNVARLFSLGKVGTQDWDNLASITLGRGGGLLVRPYRTVPTSSPPSIPAFDMRFLATWGQTSSLLFNSINGGALSTASLTGAFAINAYRIGNDLLSDDANEQTIGVINEIIVYFSELTTAQRQQVEGYLAHKWGLVGPSPTVPLSIPGCQLWLDGTDPAGTGTPPADGATVSTWVDKSGNGYNATAAPSRTVGTYSTSFRAVNFPNSTTGYITNYSAAPTNETMFVVFNNPSPSGNNNIIIGGVSGARSLGAGYTNAGNGTVGNLNTQVVWLASTGTYTAGTTVFTTSQFTPSSNSVSLNGGTFSTGGAPGFTAGRVTYLGVDATNPVYYYIGYAMEILFYNSVLTTTQRQTIESYLAKKWSIGSASTISLTHPFYSVRPHLRVFRPIDVPGCQLWLDAADSSVITIATGVSQWRDKSGNANNLTQSTTGNQPTHASSLITFESNKYLNIPVSVLNNLPTWSLFFVINPTSSSNWILAKQRDFVDTYNVLSMTLNTNNGGGIQTGSTGFLYWRSMNAGTQAVSTAAITTSTLQIINLTYDGTNLYLSKNGVLEKTTAGTFAIQNDTTPSTYTLGVSIYPGGQILNPGTTNFSLGEMMIYTSALTSSQRQQIEGYLAHKWGLIASSINPVSIPGCALWLDGTDPVGTRTPPADGATISTWVDKSGSGNSLTAVGSPTYVSASSSVYLNGSYLQNTNFNSTSYTLFIVSKQTSGNGPLYTNNTTTNGYTGFFPNYDGAYYLVQADNSWLSGGSPFANGTTYLYSIQYDSSNNINVWTNGNSTPTITGTAGTITRNQFILGKRDGNYNIGNIFEVIQYNTTLTTTQRQTIERYLAKKWSIGSTSSSLASTHPFSNFPPASLHTIVVASATGGTITTSGSYKIHAFTTVGTTTFTLTSSESITAEILIVGGGGAGGYDYGGGGGAGGAVYLSSASMPSGSYTVTVGGGGGTPGYANNGQSGSSSSLIISGTTYIGAGGGGGGAYSSGSGANGGCGGGGGGKNDSTTGNPGTGSQGFSGGFSISGGGSHGAGGGGMGSVGSNATSSNSGAPGGAGLTYTVGGTSVTVAGGGGGGGYAGGSSPGGSGIGGAGAMSNTGARGGDGTANTGSGGGGSSAYSGGGGAGGSGIVIIAYKT